MPLLHKIVDWMLLVCFKQCLQRDSRTNPSCGVGSTHIQRGPYLLVGLDLAEHYMYMETCSQSWNTFGVTAPVSLTSRTQFHWARLRAATGTSVPHMTDDLNSVFKLAPNFAPNNGHSTLWCSPDVSSGSFSIICGRRRVSTGGTRAVQECCMLVVAFLRAQYRQTVLTCTSSTRCARSCRLRCRIPAK